jgi:capsid protein
VVLPGFFDDYDRQRSWLQADWLGPGPGQIDQLKEAQASALKIKSNLSTHAAEYAADTGGRWEPVADQLSAEHDRLEELGLSAVADTSGSRGVYGDPSDNE